jgi:hypothetical chaperone protein
MLAFSTSRASPRLFLIVSSLHQCSVAANDINAVYMTGGTSFVPAIRKLFEGIFGAVPIRAGEEFTSVAEGLALFALELA